MYADAPGFRRPPGEERLKDVSACIRMHQAVALASIKVSALKYEELLSDFAFNFNLRHYVEAMNKTEVEIKERVLAAVNVRFTVAVLLIIRKQISVNGGDIFRNVFSLQF